jgi:hypothetical protein
MVLIKLELDAGDSTSSTRSPAVQAAIAQAAPGPSKGVAGEGECMVARLPTLGVADQLHSGTNTPLHSNCWTGRP